MWSVMACGQWWRSGGQLLWGGLAWQATEDDIKYRQISDHESGGVLCARARSRAGLLCRRAFALRVCLLSRENPSAHHGWPAM